MQSSRFFTPSLRHSRLRHLFRLGRTPWAVLLFLFGFGILIVIVSHYYLLPAMEAAAGATPREKRGLAAYSRLLLVVVLFVLFAGLVITFGIGRMFLPRNRPPPAKTEYVDAWAESAKRVKVPEEDDEALQ